MDLSGFVCKLTGCGCARGPQGAEFEIVTLALEITMWVLRHVDYKD